MRWPWLICCALACAAGPAVAAICPDVPAPAPPLAPPAGIADEPYEPLSGAQRSLRLGVGHLRPAHAADREDWLDVILLPLAAEPGGPITAWLSSGWVMPAEGGAPRRVGMRGALETGPNTVSLIVLEANDGGWLRVRVAPGDEATGTGWIHRCDVEKLRPQLVYEPWEEFFQATDFSALFFRTGGPRALRRAPEPAEERVAWIPAEARKYAIEPLEVQGDWMRARLTAPFDQCRAPDLKPVVREGWVRWRDPHLGPLVWYATRGC